MTKHFHYTCTKKNCTDSWEGPAGMTTCPKCGSAKHVKQRPILAADRIAELVRFTHNEAICLDCFSTNAPSTKGTCPICGETKRLYAVPHTTKD